MKNIKAYIEHIRESEKDLNIKYGKFIEQGDPLYKMPWASPTAVTREIIDEARSMLMKMPPLAGSPFVFDPDWTSSISFATELNNPVEDFDLRLTFIPFPAGRIDTQDHMNVFMSRFGRLSMKAWLSSGALPFSVDELGKVLTEISGEPLENTEASARALVSLIIDALGKIEVFLGEKLVSLKKIKRSKKVFGRG